MHRKTIEHTSIVFPNDKRSKDSSGCAPFPSSKKKKPGRNGLEVQETEQQVERMIMRRMKTIGFEKKQNKAVIADKDADFRHLF